MSPSGRSWAQNCPTHRNLNFGMFSFTFILCSPSSCWKSFLGFKLSCSYFGLSQNMLFTVFHFWAFQPSNLWPRILFISRLLCKNIKRKRTITPHNCEDIFQKCHKVLMLPMHWVDPKCNVMCLQKRYMQIHEAAFCDLDIWCGHAC